MDLAIALVAPSEEKGGAGAIVRWGEGSFGEGVSASSAISISFGPGVFLLAVYIYTGFCTALLASRYRVGAHARS